MAVIMAPDSLKCKLLAGTLSDAALRYYMNQPRFSVISYLDMTRGESPSQDLNHMPH